MSRMIRRRHRVAAATLTAGLALVTGLPPAHAVGGSVEANAVNWLRSEQQPDGGFEVAGYPGFETPDAALALASQAQTSSTWSTTIARNALAGLHYGGGAGPTPLNALDAYATGLTASPSSTGPAAKAILLNAIPLGENPAAYDPAANGNPVNLTALMDNGLNLDGTYGPAGSFNVTLYAVLANKVMGRPIPAATVAAILATQQANGNWRYDGDASGSDVDVDTTALAVEALVAAGRSDAGGAAAAAMRVLALHQLANGGWADAFGTDANPNSTAVAILAIRAAGWDPTSRAWRDRFAPERANEAYVSPLQNIAAAQAGDGHVAGPYDGYGLNTSATSQGVEALLGNWLPVATATTPVAPGGAVNAVYRASTAQWFAQGASSAVTFGAFGDLPVPADWTGSGHLTPAVFRPSSGTWYVRGVNAAGTKFGSSSTDIPVAGDYDGNGVAEIAVYRTTTGTWYTAGNTAGVRFGAPGDLPVPGVWSTSGHAEFAVYRPSTGMWYSQSNPAGTRFGSPGDIPTPGRWTSPNQLGVGVYRPANGTWFSAANPSGTRFGTPADLPMPRDWAGNGLTTIGLYRPSSGDWFTQTTPSGVRFGNASGDFPVPGPY